VVDEVVRTSPNPSIFSAPRFAGRVARIGGRPWLVGRPRLLVSTGYCNPACLGFGALAYCGQVVYTGNPPRSENDGKGE
jgi:hypothetical protein